jgi:HEAT repeat protein
MLKKILFTVLLSSLVAQAAVVELIPNLTSDDLNTQTQARLELLAICSNAGRPGAETERLAVSLEICEVLQKKQPALTVVQPLLNNLERIGGEEAVPTLTKLLSHRDEPIRDDARRALSVNPSAAAGQALGVQLRMRKVRSPKETAGFIYALGERKEPGASNLIVGYVTNKDQEIFIATVKSLGRLNEEAGIRAMAQQRSREKGFRLTQIDAALFSTSRKSVFEKLYADSEPPEVRSVALLGLILEGETGLAAGAMASEKPALQVAVIEAALQGKDTLLYDTVAATLEGLPPWIQLQALGALEFSGNRTYAKEVESILESEDTMLQKSACQTLGRIGTAASVSALIANGSMDARRALGRLDAAGVDDELEAMASEKGNDVSRSVAIDALAGRGRKDLMPDFFIYASEESKAVSAAGVKAIGQLGGLSDLAELTQLMIAKEASPVSRDILKAIVEIMRRSTEPQKAVGILVAQMDNTAPRSQANILRALVETGNDEALVAVISACKSNDKDLQKQAVKLLGSWKSDNAIPAMLELASDDSLSLANHVILIRGASRLLAGQKRVDKKLANQALEICRRSEEKQMIQDVLDKK